MRLLHEMHVVKCVWYVMRSYGTYTICTKYTLLMHYFDVLV